MTEITTTNTSVWVNAGEWFCLNMSVGSLALKRKAHDLNAEERLQIQALASLITEGRAKLIGLSGQELPFRR